MMDKVLIRSETSADVNAIAEVTVAAFKTLAISNHMEQFIIAALRAAKALTVSLVAEVDGRVVGHIAFSPVTISDGSPNWYGLGPVSVLPECQRRGNRRVDTGRDITSEGPWCPGMLPRGTSGVLQTLWVPEHPGACS
jgi:predicted N-acetyltransferase YhbS